MEGFESGGLEGFDPTPSDFVQWHRVEVVEFLAAAKDRRDQVGGFEDGEMLRDGLAAHRERCDELRKSQPVVFPQPVQELAAVGIGQGFEDFVHRHQNMQPKCCMSRVELFRGVDQANFVLGR